MARENLVGQRFDRLTVMSFEGANKSRQSMWRCACDCGKESISVGVHLKNGRIKSCGCLQKERTSQAHTKHGQYQNRLYKIWTGMRQRCMNVNSEFYGRYGGRGIKICEEWGSPTIFMSWAITHGYNKGLTIDRVDNDGDYSPENCRWATRKEQANNTRQNIKHDGLSVAEWCKRLGLHRRTAYSRLKLGWSIEKALFTPARKYINAD